MRFLFFTGIFFCTCFTRAQHSLKFTRAFRSEGYFLLRSEDPKYLDSVKKVIATTLKRNECVVLQRWLGYQNPQNEFFIVSKHFDTLVPPGVYENIYIMNENIYKATINSRYTDESIGMVDLNNTLILPFAYSEIWGHYKMSWDVKNPDRKNFVIKKNGYWGVFNLDKKKIIIPEIYTEIGFLNASNLIAEKGGSQGIIDLNNKVVVPFIYQDLGSSYRNCGPNSIPAQNDSNLWGVINIKNETKVPFKYQRLEAFSDSKMRYWKEGENGFLDMESMKETPMDTRGGLKNKQLTRNSCD